MKEMARNPSVEFGSLHCMRPVFAIGSLLVLLTLTACRTSSRETYPDEFALEFGNLGTAFGTIRFLDAGKTNDAYHWNLIALKHSITRIEELSHRGDRQQMLRSLSKAILSHMEKFKERFAQTARNDHLALKITVVLSKILDEEKDRQRLEVLRAFFASKFIEERKALKEIIE
jgi:hypothetical protein